MTNRVSFVRLTPTQVFDCPGFDRLLHSYADECANSALGPVSPDKETYAAYEASGCMGIVGALVDGQLVGAISVLVSPFAHYGVRVATTESFFVLPEFRHAGIGLELLSRAKRFAKDRGAKGLYVSAPFGSRLERIGEKAGWKKTNTVFFMGVSDDCPA